MEYSQHRPQGMITIIHLPGSASILHRVKAIFTQQWKTLLTLSGLMAVTAVVHYTLASLFHFFVKDAAQWAKMGMEIPVLILSLGAACIYALLFAAMIYVVRDRTMGLLTTPAEAIQKAKGIYKSLLWVAILLSLTTYGLATLSIGGLIGAAPSVIAAIWLYFSAYLTVMDEVKGADALSKSRYLTHGLWFKVLGRTTISSLIITAGLFIAMIPMLIPVVGWMITAVLVALLTIVAIPFQVAYDVVRLEDIQAVPRSSGWHSSSGERSLIKTFAVIGAILIAFGWPISLLNCEQKTTLGTLTGGAIMKVVEVVGPTVVANNTTLNNVINKLSYGYGGGCVVDTSTLPGTTLTPEELEMLYGGSYYSDPTNTTPSITTPSGDDLQ